jgi:hypothetical protein
VRINKDGLLGPEHSKIKPARTIRIAVVGDSFVEALQVPFENTFTAIMENQLKSCESHSDRRVEVIKFGVGGFGTAQEIQMIRHYVLAYSPDIVLLAFTTGNDVSDNSRELMKNDFYPYYVFQGNDLVLDESYLSSRWYRFRRSLLGRIGYIMVDNFRIMQVIKEVKGRWLGRKRTVQDKKITGTSILFEPGLENTMIYIEPKDDVWKEAWRTTEGLLKLIRDELAQKNIEFLLVTLSNPIQVHPNPQVRQKHIRELGVKDLFYPERRLAQFGTTEGIKVLNLAPVFQTFVEKTSRFLHGFNSTLGHGHWNDLAHRLAGQLIANRICGELIKSPGT